MSEGKTLDLTMSRISTQIPKPSATFFSNDGFALGTFVFDFGAMEFYWWDAQKAVIARCSDEHGWEEWYIQPNANIRCSITDLLDGDYYLKLTELMMFDNTELKHGVRAPQLIRDNFFRCEWSDYACDRRAVSGSIVLRDFVEQKAVVEKPVVRNNVKKVDDPVKVVPDCEPSRSVKSKFRSEYISLV